MKEVVKNSRPWLQLSANLVNDARLQSVDAEAFKLYVNMATLLCTQGWGDVLPGSLEDVAFMARQRLATVRTAASHLLDSGLIEAVEITRKGQEPQEGFRLPGFFHHNPVLTEPERKRKKRNTLETWLATVSPLASHRQATGKPTAALEEKRTRREEKRVSAMNRAPSDAPKSARRLTAEKIIKHYGDEIKPASLDSSRHRARDHVDKLLRELDPQLLYSSMTNYLESCGLLGQLPDFRKNSGNFFGQEAVFRSYLPETYQRPSPADSGADDIEAWGRGEVTDDPITAAADAYAQGEGHAGQH